MPSTDFAFHWHDEDTIREGRVLRQRGLCINKKAKDRLVARQVLAADQLSPIELLDECSWGPALDERGQCPQPVYVPSELAAVNAVLQPARARLEATTRPEHAVTFKEAMRLFGQARRERPRDFHRGINAVASTVPVDYRDVLEATNGCYLHPEASLLPVEELAAFNKETNCILAQYGNGAGSYFHFASSVSGDWYSIDMSSGTERSRAVVRFSHETNDVVYRWKDMALFLYDVLTGFYD